MAVDYIDREVTAYHEAGHVVAAWVLDRPFGAVSIEPTGQVLVGRG